MVYFEKTAEAPVSLAQEKGKNGSYLKEDVIDQLDEDFHGKCYICETQYPTGINVEHFIPHHGNIDLMYDWNNLFLACPHCNNTKEMLERDRNHSGGFLNCTVAEDRVDECISYRVEVDSLLISKIKIAAVQKLEEVSDARITNTVDLLNNVYNGTTPLKSKEARNIRYQLLDEMDSFQRLLIKYETSSNEAREEVTRELEKALKNDTPFTAFKRWRAKDCAICLQIHH